MAEILESIDADEAKAVVGPLLDVAAEIAAMTPWPADDKAVAVAKDLINRPLVWAVVIRLINKALPEGTEAADPELVDAMLRECPEAIDPVTIVALITTLLPLIKQGLAWWKQRRQGPAPTPAPSVV